MMANVLHVVVNLKLKSQSKRQKAFIWDQRITVGAARIQAETQTVSPTQGEGRGFCKKTKGNNSMNRRKKFLVALTS